MYPSCKRWSDATAFPFLFISDESVTANQLLQGSGLTAQTVREARSVTSGKGFVGRLLLLDSFLESILHKYIFGVIISGECRKWL